MERKRKAGSGKWGLYKFGGGEVRLGCYYVTKWICHVVGKSLPYLKGCYGGF